MKNLDNQHDDLSLNWIAHPRDVRTSASDDDQDRQEGTGRFRRSTEDPPYEPERGFAVGAFIAVGSVIGIPLGYVLGRWIVPSLLGLL